MIRRYSFRVWILTVALALTAGVSAQAQGKKAASRARTTARKTAGAEQATDLGFGVAESLSGSVQMVAADQDLLVVKGPNDVPYDLKVTPKTLVVVGEKKGTIQSLADQVGEHVIVAFTPQRDGNFATRVEVTD
jgi:hypothetical protein